MGTPVIVAAETTEPPSSGVGGWGRRPGSRERTPVSVPGGAARFRRLRQEPGGPEMCTLCHMVTSRRCHMVASRRSRACGPPASWWSQTGHSPAVLGPARLRHAAREGGLQPEGHRVTCTVTREGCLRLSHSLWGRHKPQDPPYKGRGDGQARWLGPHSVRPPLECVPHAQQLVPLKGAEVVWGSRDTVVTCQGPDAVLRAL